MVTKPGDQLRLAALHYVTTIIVYEKMSDEANSPKKKTVQYLIQNLRSHFKLLQAAAKGIGRNEEEYYILAATELRTLVCSGSGQIPLLFHVADLVGCELKFKYTIPPEWAGKEEKLKTYMERNGATIHGKKYSNFAFIKFCANASGDQLHVKDEINEGFAIGESIRIMGITPNQVQLKAIMNTVGNCAGDLIKQIDTLTEDDLGRINNKINK